MKYLFALVLALASVGSAFADSRDTITYTVPFDFVIGNKTFPAGTYSISRASDQPSYELMIRSKDGKTAALFHPITAAPSNSNGEIKLQFRHEGDKYFLMEVFSELDTYTINSSHSHHKAASPDDTVTVTP